MQFKKKIGRVLKLWVVSCQEKLAFAQKRAFLQMDILDKYVTSEHNEGIGNLLNEFLQVREV